MELKLKILRVTGGSAGQMIKLGLISPEPDVLAARIVKEKDSAFIEFFTKTTDHGLVEGDAFALSLDPDEPDSTPAALSPTPSSPTAAAAVATTPATSAAQVAPAQPDAQQTAIKAQEQKLADDAEELAALKRAEAAGHTIPQPPAPVTPAVQPVSA